MKSSQSYTTFSLFLTIISLVYLIVRVDSFSSGFVFFALVNMLFAFLTAGNSKGFLLQLGGCVTDPAMAISLIISKDYWLQKLITIGIIVSILMGNLELTIGLIVVYFVSAVFANLKPKH